MAELTISIPSESKSLSNGPYTPIDELGDAMIEESIVYETFEFGESIHNYKKVLVEISISEAINIIINYYNHINESRILGLNRCIYIHPMISFLSKNNIPLLSELKCIVKSLNPNPCNEFIENLKKREKDKIDKEESREKKRKDIMGEKYQKYFEIIKIVADINNELIRIKNLIQECESSINLKSSMISKKYSDKIYKHSVNEVKHKNLIELEYKKIEDLLNQKSKIEKKYNYYEPIRIELKKEYDSIN